MRVVYCFCLVLLAFALLSCKRTSDQERLRQDIASITNPLVLSKAIVERWAATNATSPANQLLTNALLTGISGTERAATNEAVFESADATSFFLQLLKDGKAPGVSKGEHRSVTCDSIVFESNGVAVKTFPAERTFRVLKNGDTYTNNYFLVKESKEADWKLKRAWKVDLNGNLIKEWPCDN